MKYLSYHNCKESLLFNLVTNKQKLRKITSFKPDPLIVLITPLSFLEEPTSTGTHRRLVLNYFKS